VSRSVPERLQDILDAIARARLADRLMSRAEAMHDEDGVSVAFDAILHNLFVMGEAVKSLPDELLLNSTEIPWNDIAALRDVIGHHYHRVIPAIIHSTVRVDLTPLEVATRELMHYVE